MLSSLLEKYYDFMARTTLSAKWGVSSTKARNVGEAWEHEVRSASDISLTMSAKFITLSTLKGYMAEGQRVHTEKKRSDKNENRIMEKTLKAMEKRRKSSLTALVVLLILHLVLYAAVRITAGSTRVIRMGGSTIPVLTLTGVFSTVSNLCTILMVVFCGKAGFIASLFLMLLQYPMILQGIIIRRNYSSIPGLFGNLLTIVTVIVIFLNNRRIEKYQDRLLKQATTDLLTGLPNSFAATGLISELIKQKRPFAAVSIDVDGLNSINNTMGFDMGNRALIEVSSRWKKIADGSLSGTLDFISRISGDEFSLIIRDYDSIEDIEKTIRQYEDATEQRIRAEGYDLSLSASFGYAVFPADTDDFDSLIYDSYSAMREIKRLKNGEHILHFTPELIKTRDQLSIDNKVRDALEKDLIYFNLQPQFDMSHKLRGFEVLARMKDSEGNFIRPDEFIPAAERLGLISSVDLEVHKKAAEFFSDLLEKSGADITLSINVSVKHMMKKDFMDEIREFVENCGIPPSRIEIEITESVLIESAEEAARKLTELKKMGVMIAIDDFGTGYSSLSYLNSFPSDVLKIDKSFIDKMNSGDRSQKYVEAIISLAHVMDLEVIAEGVEEPGQLEILRNINCDFIQGYIWGKPLSAEEAGKLVMG